MSNLKESYPLRCGFFRDDGMVFWSHHPECKNGEWWVSVEKFHQLKEKSRQQQIRRREASPEKSKESSRNWKSRNKKDALEYTRKYRESNLLKCSKSQQVWRFKNPHKIGVYNAVRRSLIKGGLVKLLPHQKEIIDQIYMLSKRVSECTKIKHHVDHIIPLTRGGIHSPCNLQILPAIINIKKGNRLTYCPCSVDSHLPTTAATVKGAGRLLLR
jgi:hypothetical protein